MQPVLQYLIDTAVNAPDSPAIVCDDRVVSYREFINKIHSLANLLTQEGLKKGDRAVILLRDKSEFLVACFSLMNIGAIAVPVPEHITLHSLQEIVKDSTPTLLITSATELPDFPRLRSNITCNLFLLEEKNISADYSHSIVLREQHSSTAPVKGNDFAGAFSEDKAFIWYTTGSKGMQQGIVFSQNNIICGAVRPNALTGTSSSTRECIMMPLAREFGFSRCCSLFFAGGTAILSNTVFDPVSMIQSVLRYRCNALSLMPSVITSMFGYLEPMIQRIGAQISLINMEAFSMSAEHKLRMKELFPNANIFMHYGTSEAPHSAILNFNADNSKLETAGHLIPGTEICIISNHDSKESAVESGEVHLRGDNIMIGYWNNDELTNTTITSEGWCKTGDIGFIDEEKYLHLTERNDETIIVGGLRFSSLEIEEHVKRYFPEHEVFVVGIPDPAGILGEIPVLCYKANNGKTLTASDLSRVLSNKIDGVKIPRIVYRIETDTAEQSKLTRKDLRLKFLNQFSKSAQHEQQPQYNKEQYSPEH